MLNSVCLAAPLLIGAVHAGAQTESVTLEEIVVTAQRRAESIQTVPMSITALTEERLTRQGVEALTDYAASTPGVAFTDTGALGSRAERTLIIRGISSAGNAVTTSGTVGFYLDDAPIPTLDPEIFDVARIEFLKGPQSTLYGAGSVGGTLRVIMNQPKLDQFEGKGEASLGSTRGGSQFWSAKGAVNVPIAETAALRASAWYRHDGGWIDNYALGADTPAGQVQEDWNDMTISGGRLAMRIEPTDTLAITPSVHVQRGESEGAFDTDPRLPPYRSRSQVLDTGSTEDFDLYSLPVTYDAGWAELTSSTSYFHREYHGRENSTAPLGGIPPAGFPEPPDADIWLEPRIFTQELRLVSPREGRIDWIAGAFYSYKKQQYRFFQDYLGAVLLDAESDIRVRERSVYAEVTVHLTDKLSVTGGLRRYELVTSNSGSATGTFTPGGSTPTLTHVSSRETGVRPKANISYQVSDDVMLYATASQGLRPGGGLPNLPESICGDAFRALGYRGIPTAFESDSVWNYETGAKTAWLDRRLIVNGAVFYLDWTDIQQAGNLGSLGCPFAVTLNSGEAVSRGFELETTVVPSDGLELTLGVGYTDAELSKPSLAGAGSKGDPLIGVPRWNAHAAAEYTFPIRDGFDLMLRADYTYVDSRSTSFLPQAVPELEAYDLANLQIGLLGERWETVVFARNLFDTRGQTSYVATGAQPGTIPSQSLWLTRPRQIGLSLRTKF